jgi:hypothetical protein
MEAGLEQESEHVSTRCPLNLEDGVGLGRHREIPLTTEVERLERDRHRLSVLITQAEPEAAERVGRHRVSVAFAHRRSTTGACYT